MPTAAQQLDAARAGLEACRRHGHEVANTFDESRWIARPPSGGWSPAECFAHLNLTTNGMLPLMRAGVAEARQKAWPAPPSYRVGLLARLLRWVLEPPYRMKTATQPAFVPERHLTKADVLHNWDEGHRALAALIDDARGLGIDKALLVSPFDPRGKMRYSVYAALLIIAAHERRHLWQARRAAG